MKNTSNTEISNTEVADCYLGNLKADTALAAQIAQSRQAQRCLEVTIGRQDCRKGRIFTSAASGQTVGIVKGRDWQLKDGDVLRTQRDRLVLVSLKKQQVIALQFDQTVDNSPVQLVHLGHAIGNHHWPITLREETLYIELVGNGDTIESTIKKIVETLKIEGVNIVRESKSAEHILDFSSADFLPHSHDNSHSHSHSHSHEHQ